MSEVRHPLSRLLSQLEEHRSVVILASICSILNKVWDLAPPVLIGMAIDVVSARENSFLANMGYEDVHLQLYILTGYNSRHMGPRVTFPILLCGPLEKSRSDSSA